MRATFLVLLLLTTVACQAAGEALSRGQYQRQEQLTRAFAEAFVANDHHKLSLLYAADAVMLPPNAPEIVGREAIRQYFEAMPAILEADIRTIEAHSLESRVFVRGEYAMVMDVDGERVEDRGKYIELRERGQDGVWRITRDMYSSDLPPQGGH